MTDLLRITIPDAPKPSRIEGPAGLIFIDGVCEFDPLAFPTMEMYAERHGYDVEHAKGKAPAAAEPTGPTGDVVHATFGDVEKLAVTDLRRIAVTVGVDDKGSKAAILDRLKDADSDAVLAAANATPPTGD